MINLKDYINESICEHKMYNFNDSPMDMSQEEEQILTEFRSLINKNTPDSIPNSIIEYVASHCDKELKSPAEMKQGKSYVTVASYPTAKGFTDFAYYKSFGKRRDKQGWVKSLNKPTPDITTKWELHSLYSEVGIAYRLQPKESKIGSFDDKTNISNYRIFEISSHFEQFIDKMMNFGKWGS